MKCAQARQIATSVPQGILVDHTPDARISRSPEDRIERPERSWIGPDLSPMAQQLWRRRQLFREARFGQSISNLGVAIGVYLGGNDIAARLDIRGGG